MLVDAETAAEPGRVWRDRGQITGLAGFHVLVGNRIGSLIRIGANDTEARGGCVADLRSSQSRSAAHMARDVRSAYESAPSLPLLLPRPKARSTSSRSWVLGA